MKLVKLERGKHPLAVCNDGNSAGYYFKVLSLSLSLSTVPPATTFSLSLSPSLSPSLSLKVRFGSLALPHVVWAPHSDALCNGVFVRCLIDTYLIRSPFLMV